MPLPLFWNDFPYATEWKFLLFCLSLSWGISSPQILSAICEIYRLASKRIISVVANEPWDWLSTFSATWWSTASQRIDYAAFEHIAHSSFQCDVILPKPSIFWIPEQEIHFLVYLTIFSRSSTQICWQKYCAYFLKDQSSLCSQSIRDWISGYNIRKSLEAHRVPHILFDFLIE